jgi:hypothetical protein
LDVLNFGGELDVDTFPFSKKGVGVEEESIVFPKEILAFGVNLFIDAENGECDLALDILGTRQYFE